MFLAQITWHCHFQQIMVLYIGCDDQALFNLVLIRAQCGQKWEQLDLIYKIAMLYMESSAWRMPCAPWWSIYSHNQVAVEVKCPSSIELPTPVILAVMAIWPEAWSSHLMYKTIICWKWQCHVACCLYGPSISHERHQKSWHRNFRGCCHSMPSLTKLRTIGEGQCLTRTGS